ncbi:uncharacterized protein [Chironomus tepperi]|uniref:uncharacterized protein n=1 Tax=Chironomus tepperi TaxID=113505 RepID=UPI00391F3A2F
MVDGPALFKTILIVIGLFLLVVFSEFIKNFLKNSNSNYTQDYSQSLRLEPYAGREEEEETEYQPLRNYDASLEIPEFRPRPGQRSHSEIVQQIQPTSVTPSRPPTIGWINELSESNDLPLPSYGEAINQLSRSNHNLSTLGQPASQLSASRSTNHLNVVPSAPPAGDVSQDNYELPSYGEAMIFLASKQS